MAMAGNQCGAGFEFWRQEVWPRYNSGLEADSASGLPLTDSQNWLQMSVWENPARQHDDGAFTPFANGRSEYR